VRCLRVTITRVAPSVRKISVPGSGALAPPLKRLLLMPPCGEFAVPPPAILKTGPALVQPKVLLRSAFPLVRLPPLVKAAP
jgi:hypothetical protein